MHLLSRSLALFVALSLTGCVGVKFDPFPWWSRDTPVVEAPPAPSDSEASRLKVLAYNAFMRPSRGFFSFADGQRVRARLIAKRISALDVDVIIFSELFDDGARRLLLERLRTVFPFQTSVVDRRGSLENGGIVIVSRWPLEDRGHLAFSYRSGPDAFAAKGVKHAVITKGDRRYNVFGAHMQDTDTAVRAAQLWELRRYIESRGIPEWEPIVIGGDMNVDRARTREYTGMLSTLAASFPDHHSGHAFTWDGVENDLATGRRRALLDYVLSSDSHLRPLHSSLETIILREKREWRPGNRDLSDHFAVRGSFSYAEEPTAPLYEVLPGMP